MNASVEPPPAGPEHDAGIGLAGREGRGDPGLLQQRRRGAQHQDRLAVPVLILHEVQRRGRRRRAFRRPPRRPAARRRRRAPTAPLPGASTSMASPAAGFDRARARRRRSAPRRRPRSALGDRRSDVAVAAIGHEDGDAPRADAAVAGPRKQRQRRRRRHFGRDPLSAPSASVPAVAHAEALGHRLGQLRRDVHQSRHHPLANGRRLHPRQLEAERVDDVRLLDGVWLFQNSVACV